MKKLIRFVLVGFILIGGVKVYAQDKVVDTLKREAIIVFDLDENKVTCSAEVPPLNQIEGAPKAFYTYFWEYGDGQYSQKENPIHNYKNPGEYNVRLWTTNNYDNGKPPESRPKRVVVEAVFNDQASADDAKAPFLYDDDLYIKTNRDPLPEEELVLVTTYKNINNYVTSGKLYLFYNDAKYKYDNFNLEDTRVYNDENIIDNQPILAFSEEKNISTSYLATSDGNLEIEHYLYIQDSTKRFVLPVTLEESKILYRNHQLIEFDNMQPGEERNIFRTLKTTPEMLKDTSAIVTLRTIYVPDNNYGNHTVKDTELEIVTSHDPNKMATSGAVLNYRLARFKRIKFKIRFQNNGEGPANTIKLDVDTPEMYDKLTLEVVDMYPKVPICPKGKEVNYSCLDTTFQKGKIIFTFKNIYLPGSNQKKVTEKDSTKGFVKYSMKFGKKFHKQKTRSRTAIYFDKNPPIYTNYAVTRFITGISIGAKAGYIFTPGLDNQKEYMAGITISPFKSYKGYFQTELFFSANSFEDLSTFETSQINGIGIEEITRYNQINKTNNITAYLVPFSYRYNLNNFIALGAGVQLKLDLSSKCLKQTTGKAFLNIPDVGEIPDETQDTYQETKCSNSFTNFQSGLFAGINFGGVRIGPSVGLRYVRNFNAPTSQIQVYGVWKF